MESDDDVQVTLYSLSVVTKLTAWKGELDKSTRIVFKSLSGKTI